MRCSTLLVLAFIAFNEVFAADSSKRSIDFNSERIGVLGLPLSESKEPTYRVVITGQVGDNGEGRGLLVLDLTEPPVYDQFGFVTTAAPTREIKLDCVIKLVNRTTKVFTVRVGGPGSDKYEEVRETWTLYSITGSKITSRLFLALPPDSPYPVGRFLVQDNKGTVKHSIGLIPPPQPEPCHPGCFPAGTVVRVPGGTTPIEQVKPGAMVTTISTEGLVASAKVETVFVTRNRLLEVRTMSGTLVTTETQPLALEGGDYRLVGELKPGDRIWRWSDGKRLAVPVLSVKMTGREAQVFNIILGAPTTFIAGDFLARSKPPVEVRP